MKTKTWWNKLPLDEKAIVILFLMGFSFLITGMIILLNIRIDAIYNGFNMIYINGIINTLNYNSAKSLIIDVFFLKLGTIFIIFLMPICISCSIIWFVIKRLVLKK